MDAFLRLEGKAEEDFYQAKYDYYKRFNLVILFVSALIFFILIVTDWQVTEQFSWQSLLIRSLVVIPLAVVVLAYRKTSNYRIMSAISLMMVHVVIWGNIWAGSYVVDQSYVNESFMIMSFILLLVAFSAPPFYAMAAQLALIGDILLADQLYHFPNLDVILSFNVPVIVLLCFLDLIATGFYYDHYITQKKLDFALFHDPLTQVFNRRQLHKIMGEGHNLSFMSDAIAIVIMDVDHFKQVNDTYGHDEGDRILQFVADCIRHSLRGPDLVIRWGGQEFVAILFDCQRDKASLVAERIRCSVEKSVNGVSKITISLGVAIYEGGDCFETIKKADQALHVAKRNGRNQVVCYENLDREALDLDGDSGHVDA
ncbi:diguanylate cyclase [Acetobacterium sp.]|uniref:GGDEF domain-containing protein n=1 Tax=Acetobacterium sp. TaxID=1872094 RepID=UPI00271AE00F|nr:GGDEF domain-containing protein [Acetobacterium sp.]MDO9494004.1 GGDEF domain-containing protein [Acetobacterium sp.]